MPKKSRANRSEEDFMTSESSWIDRFYSHFIGRDLAQLFAGGLFICVCQYAFLNKISFFPQQLSLELLGFLAASYFIGILLYGIITWRFPSLDHLKIHKGYSSSSVLFQDLIENYDSRIINQYERGKFIMVTGSSIGSSSLFGGIVMIIAAIRRFLFEGANTSFYYGLAFVLIIYGILMLYYAERTGGWIAGEQCALIEAIRSEK